MSKEQTSHDVRGRGPISWPAPPPEPGLPRGEVHVFRASLDQSDARIGSLLETLSPDEKKRAERLISLRDRYRFIVARGVLREILSRYLKREPRSIEFQYHKGRKPALVGDEREARIRFNLSHTRDLALLALCLDREVGIDLEHLGRELKFMGLARRFFSKEEVSALTGVPEDKRKEAFLAIWTRKEAYLKATGRGIAVSLKEVKVPTDFMGPREPVTLEGGQHQGGIWSLVELDAGPDFKASLVVEGGGFRLRLFRWQREGSGGPG